LASVDDRKETSLRVCIAHMLDIDASEVPTKREANIGQWLASRNLGLVPVASPEGFEWPGRFLGLRSDSSTWAVFFGVPPGIVYDPLPSRTRRSRRRVWMPPSCSLSTTRGGGPNPVRVRIASA
jgi:hypothetical protein